MKKNLIHGTMALLFVLVVCITSAAAVDDTVTRDLPDSASAGASITVDLTVDVETGATYYGIDEIVPSGWTVTSATDDGDYTTTTGHVMWAVTAGAADKTYSYTVEVPADASGAYTFDGIYAFEGMTAEATILGDTTVIVGDVDTVTRDLPDSASAGASITVDLTVDVETGATYYGIDEIVPSGWTVTSATDDGDYTTTTGHVMWAVTAGAADKTYSYTVEVPADATGAYTFDGIYAFEGMTAEATILGDTELTVGAAAAPTCTVSVTNTTIVPPQTTDITVTFSEKVQYTLNIETSDGAVVYDWTGERSTDRTVTWNGSYEVDGTQVPDGTYKVNLTVTNTTTELTGYDRTGTIVVSSGAAPTLASITISPPSCTVNVGDSQPFDAVCKDATGAEMTCPTLTWTSTNETVGTITSEGVFTAAITGTTTVTAENGTVNDTASVTVATVRPVTLVHNSNNLGYNYIAWTGSVETSASALADMIVAGAGAGVVPDGTTIAYYNTTDGIWHVFLVGINDPGSEYDFAISQYGVISIKVNAEGTFQMPRP